MLKRSLAAVALVFAAAVALAADKAQYTANPGPHRVLTIDQVVLHDAARKKDLALKIYYPEGAGPFPVVVFSHGLYASKDIYWALAQYWASYGYVSIHYRTRTPAGTAAIAARCAAHLPIPSCGAAVPRTFRSSSTR